ncbi:hypothetical protein KIN20_030007 [Parelaphostrongylus tenuis]|uniref:Uncharacterized protein n=1 Tax=Parelaphostrongylus tenuis TaxID=148309 RepID=A0AAD5R3F1_PARTN|nr:hypothetical protein KIN20_030007 [Parelaphostrongylus tenuis]
MVDRNKNKSRPTGTSHIVEPNDLSPEGSSDPWASIENGDAVAAREVFYREASPREQRVKHYEKFKKKRKRMSDGVKVVRMEVHPRIPRSTKRALVNGTAVESDSPSHRVPPEKLRRSDSDSKVNIFAN